MALGSVTVACVSSRVNAANFRKLYVALFSALSAQIFSESNFRRGAPRSEGIVTFFAAAKAIKIHYRPARAYTPFPAVLSFALEQRLPFPKIYSNMGEAEIHAASL
ncbi:hypothetical protein Trydic_g15840 [Trypoxylus dichotomus]